MKRSPVGSAAFVALAVTAVLAGCDKKPAPARSTDQVMAEAGELPKPQPGQYETTVKLLAFSVPGVPPAQAEKIKAMMGNIAGEASSSCLTAGEANKGFEESIRKIGEGQQGLKCDFAKFDVNNGKLVAEMVCKGPQGLEADMQVDGTATAQSTSMHMAIQQKAAMIPGGEMRMEMQMDSRRTGECAG